MAERGRSLWRPSPVLRPERDELLHRFVRCVASTWCVGFFGLGQSAGSADREAEIHVHGRLDEAAQSNVKQIRKHSRIAQYSTTASVQFLYSFVRNFRIGLKRTAVCLCECRQFY